MNHAVILSGGVESRFGAQTPKQYIEVEDIPIWLYTFRIFSSYEDLDTIVFVLEDQWRDSVQRLICQENCHKTVLYAPAGKSRQHSILNGLRALKGTALPKDIVIIHDAVRPLLEHSIISEGITTCAQCDAVVPYVTVKDTVYLSSDGVSVGSLLPRDQLYAGQAPEFFKFGKYLAINEEASDECLSATRGSVAIAFMAGCEVRLIKGSERNLKITTPEDLLTFKTILSKK